MRDKGEQGDKQRHGQITQVSVAFSFFLPLCRDEKQAQSQQTCQHLQTEGAGQCLSACACAHVLGNMPRRREGEKKKFTSEAVELLALPLRAAEDESHSIKLDRYTGTTEGCKIARAVSVHNVFVQVCNKIFALARARRVSGDVRNASDWLLLKHFYRLLLL